MPTFTPTLVVPSCVINNSCEDQNPEYSGCANPSALKNSRFIFDSSDDLLGTLENKYSVACSSLWVTVFNESGQNMYVGASMRWGIGNINGYYDLDWKTEESSAVIEPDEKIYTPMHVVNGDPSAAPALGCGGFSTTSVVKHPALGSLTANHPYVIDNCLAR